MGTPLSDFIQNPTAQLVSKLRQAASSHLQTRNAYCYRFDWMPYITRRYRDSMLLRTSSKRAARWVGDCRPSYPGVHVGLGAAGLGSGEGAGFITLSLLCGGTGGGDAAGAILSDTCDPSFEANTLREESLANLSARVAGSLLPDP